MSFSKIHSKLLPKMGQFAGHALPLRFCKFNTNDVVINTRKPDFSTVFDVSHMGVFESNVYDIEANKVLESVLNIDLSKIKANKAKLSVILDSNEF